MIWVVFGIIEFFKPYSWQLIEKKYAIKTREPT